MGTADELRYICMTANEDKLRKKLHDEINSALKAEQQLFTKELDTRQKITKCRQKLRTLENCVGLCDICLFEATPLTDFFMNICYACDLALAGTGKRVVFSGSANCAFICRDAVMRQVLNLISNAALYSDNPVISARLKEFNRQAFFTVYSSADADMIKMQKSLDSEGSGLWYVSKVSQLHGSAALFSRYDRSLRAGIKLKTSATSSQTPVRDFTSLLCDRLSPIYTHLSTVEGI